MYKTNWKPSDGLTLEDYGRICGNIRRVYGLAVQLYPQFALVQLRSYTTSELPDLAFFTSIEENLGRLYTSSFTRKGYSIRAMEENGTVWDWRDLNRIEDTLRQLEHDLLTQRGLRQPMPRRMGGGQFATLI